SPVATHNALAIAITVALSVTFFSRVGHAVPTPWLGAIGTTGIDLGGTVRRTVIARFVAAGDSVAAERRSGRSCRTGRTGCRSGCTVITVHCGRRHRCDVTRTARCGSGRAAGIETGARLIARVADPRRGPRRVDADGRSCAGAFLTAVRS